MAGSTQTSGTLEVRPGHWWKEADRVSEYVARWDREAGDNTVIFRLLTDLLPFDHEAPLRVLDIGSGHGVVAAAMLDAFPNAQAVGLDISEPMMTEGKTRMARYGDRFRYFEGDFADGSLPAGLTGPFDLTVSSRAIHHLPPEGKRLLYADVFRHTAPGGACFNIDNMRPRDDFLRQRYSQADPTRQPARPAGVAPRPQGTGGREFPDPVVEQLALLREAGFAHVDCYWKMLGRAMIGGFRES